MRIYGLPYKGSKSGIAEWVLSNLPPADVFVDLFCGGCAMTHAAMLSGKYRRFVCNDILGDMPGLFVDAVKGRYRNETRWISREDFFRLKGTDPYVKVCWSFGNNGRNYLYSREIEPWKKAVHYARVFGDRSRLAEFGIQSDGSRADILAHHEEYKARYVEWVIKTLWQYPGDYKELVDGLKNKVERGKEELRQYLLEALKESGLTQAEVNRRLGTQTAGHYFSRSQWAFPTREAYNKMRGFMPMLKPYVEVYGLQYLMQRLGSLQSLQSLQRLQSLESLQSLQSLQRLQRLQRLQSLGRLESLQSLERLQRLERLERLQRLQSNVVTVMSKDYAGVEIPADSVVYCDPPYKGTDGYGDNKKGEGGFDHGRFYDWLRHTGFPVWVSEYWMPGDFVCVGMRKKTVTLSAVATSIRMEKLFVHERWAERVGRSTLFGYKDFV